MQRRSALSRSELLNPGGGDSHRLFAFVGKLIGRRPRSRPRRSEWAPELALGAHTHFLAVWEYNLCDATHRRAILSHSGHRHGHLITDLEGL